MDTSRLTSELRLRYLEGKPLGEESSSSWQEMGRVPRDGLIHRETGNAVFAMSIDGILVVMPSGEFQWVEVGTFRHAPFPTSAAFGTMLSVIWPSLVALIPLLFSTYALAFRSIGPWHQAFLCCNWLLWVIAPLLIKMPVTPIEVGNVEDFFFELAYAAMLMTSGSLSITSMLVGGDGVEFRWRNLAVVLGMTVLGAGLFALPYALWANAAAPHYRTATILAVVIASACGASGYYFCGKRYSWQGIGAGRLT